MPFSSANQILRRLTPASLFGRAMLIVVLPTFFVQIVSTYMFYERHWDNVRKHMAIALADEIAYVAAKVRDPDYRWQALAEASRYFHLRSVWEPPAMASPQVKISGRFSMLARQLRTRVDEPFAIAASPDDDGVTVRLFMPDGVLVLEASEKRVASVTTYIFILWMNGAALLFLVVAVLFLRNQVRPIEQLAQAAEDFGRGRETEGYRPRGAQEVRRAGQAFLLMKERILRQMTKRTEMLAAISHDLRTPITRMKLELAMLPDGEAAQALHGDIAEMEAMIDEYLDYVRGAGGEQSRPVAIVPWLEQLLAGYRREGREILFHPPENREVNLREQAFRRCMTNLLNNALRYGTKVEVRGAWHEGALHLFVDDNGPGIPENERQNVFKAFRKLDKSRKPGDGGVGLGLSIAKDIVLSHGGTIDLERSKMGGLRVHLVLPAEA